MYFVLFHQAPPCISIYCISHCHRLVDIWRYLFLSRPTIARVVFSSSIVFYVGCLTRSTVHKTSINAPNTASGLQSLCSHKHFNIWFYCRHNLSSSAFFFIYHLRYFNFVRVRVFFVKLFFRFYEY